MRPEDPVPAHSGEESLGRPRPSQSLSFFLRQKEDVSPDLHSSWGCLKVSQMAVCILHGHGGFKANPDGS